MLVTDILCSVWNNMKLDWLTATASASVSASESESEWVSESDGEILFWNRFIHASLQKYRHFQSLAKLPFAPINRRSTSSTRLTAPSSSPACDPPSTLLPSQFPSATASHEDNHRITAPDNRRITIPSLELIEVIPSFPLKAKAQRKGKESRRWKGGKMLREGVSETRGGERVRKQIDDDSGRRSNVVRKAESISASTAVTVNREEASDTRTR